MAKRISETAAIVAIFSFGSEGTRGNKNLAICGMHEAHKEGSLMIITQKDVPNTEKSYKKYGLTFEEEFFCPFVFVEEHEISHGWHSTLWVASVARKICERHEFSNRMIVVAAPMHIRRVARDLKKVGFEVVETVSPKLKGEDSWYEKGSSLPWTRSWWRWWSREIILRLLPWSAYKWLTLREK